MENFELGRLVTTSTVHDLMQENEQFHIDVSTSLSRYISNDWGDLCDEDKQMNNDALTYEDRILGKYHTCVDDIYIITEWDRSATTILFTNEY